jgi:hypothetical protein
MRTRWLLALVLLGATAVAIAVGFPRSGPDTPAPSIIAAPRPSAPLLGIVSGSPQRDLVRVDPGTLRPKPGMRIDLGTEGCARKGGGTACWGVPPWSFSADRSLLAVALNDGGVARSLRLVDVGRMRVATDVLLAGGAVGLVALPGRERMLAVQQVCCAGAQQLLVVDVARRRVAARRSLGGAVLRAGRTPLELVLLLAPVGGIGPARLAVVDGRGAVRFLELERMPAGMQDVGRTSPGVGQRLPGLAVDAAGRRAFVVSPGLVAVVDLARLAVSYHEPMRAVSALARLRDWLDPAAYAKGASGPTRVARWLGGGLLAVAGADAQVRVVAAGVSLVDTRNWSVRTIADGATDVRVAGGLLLATGSSEGFSTGGADAIGLAAYDRDGDKRFQLFDGRQAWVTQVYDGRAYVGIAGQGGEAPLRVVDLAAGRSAGVRTQPLPWLLLDAASSWWDS